jgi:hypothetical protein
VILPQVPGENNGKAPEKPIAGITFLIWNEKPTFGERYAEDGSSMGRLIMGPLIMGRLIKDREVVERPTPPTSLK